MFKSELSIVLIISCFFFCCCVRIRRKTISDRIIVVTPATPSKYINTACTTGNTCNTSCTPIFRYSGNDGIIYKSKFTFYIYFQNIMKTNFNLCLDIINTFASCPVLLHIHVKLFNLTF